MKNIGLLGFLLLAGLQLRPNVSRLPDMVNSIGDFVCRAIGTRRQTLSSSRDIGLPNIVRSILSDTKSLMALVGLSLAATFTPVWAHPVALDWQKIGGQNVFERQGLMFNPIQVDSFVRFESDGMFRNLVGTQYSTIKALMFIRIAGAWELFAEDDSVRGPYLSEVSLADFVFLPVDFSKGPVSGLNITNSGAGATQYFGMTDGNGTHFTFDAATVPEPGSLALVAISIAILFRGRLMSARRG